MIRNSKIELVNLFRDGVNRNLWKFFKMLRFIEKIFHYFEGEMKIQPAWND